MLLRQNNRNVLLAQVQDNLYGIDLHRLPGWQSPIPPIRAAEARHLAGDPTRWAHKLAPHLTEFLHNGEWLLTWPELPSYTFTEDLIREETEIDWFIGWNGTLPLRRLSDVDDSRVKAYRKLARDGTLPPVVLWWQSGFNGYFVIDGHDRLLAAREEAMTPPALVLSRASTSEWLPHATARHEEVIRHIEAQMANGAPHAATARETHIRRFAELATIVPNESARSVAWPLPGGVTEWERIAAQVT